MRRWWSRAAGVLAVAAASLLLPLTSPRAEEVRLEHAGLTLLANYVTVPGKPVADVPVALIVHGSLAHHGMEIVATLQHNLKQKGVPSLAMTLSLGVDQRRGMLDCNTEHDHRPSDAIEEIALWIGWLKERGARHIVMTGHSRGAQQAMFFVTADAEPMVEKLVLIAPPSDTPEQAAARYKAAAGGDLDVLVAAARKLVDSGEEDRVIEVPGFLHCKQSRVSAAAFLDYNDSDPRRSVFALMPDVQRPTLVVAGSSDQISPGVAARMKAEPPGPHVRIEVVDGADHFFRDLFADDLADRIAAFIEEP